MISLKVNRTIGTVGKSGRVSYEAGSVVSVSDKLAKTLISNGWAEQVADEKKPDKQLEADNNNDTEGSQNTEQSNTEGLNETS